MNCWLWKRMCNIVSIKDNLRTKFSVVSSILRGYSRGNKYMLKCRWKYILNIFCIHFIHLFHKNYNSKTMNKKKSKKIQCTFFNWKTIIKNREAYLKGRGSPSGRVCMECLIYIQLKNCMFQIHDFYTWLYKPHIFRRVCMYDLYGLV